MCSRDTPSPLEKALTHALWPEKLHIPIPKPRDEKGGFLTGQTTGG